MGTLFIFFCTLTLINIATAQLFFDGNLPKGRKKEPTTFSASDSTGKPLILTPYIQNYDDFRARQLARVDKKHFLDVVSYSGYLTVDSKYNSNLWFWFFPAEGTEDLYDKGDFAEYDFDEDKKKKVNTNKNEANITNSKLIEKPLILWLQGGPGASSLFGLFTENGPFFVEDEGMSLTKNNFSWHRNYSMLFIDNPVGAGFSFTDDEENGYTTNAAQVGQQLYKGLMQFFRMFPMLQKAPFFVSGESYAGKWIPAIGYEIFKQNKNDDIEFPINLQGLMIGNGFTDPPNMLGVSDWVFQAGLVDYHARNQMKVFEILAQENIKRPDSKVFWDLVLYSFIRYSRYLNLYNILQPGLINLETYLDFVEQAHIRKALHIGNIPFSPPSAVYYSHIEDFMSSAMPWVEDLLEENLRIMFYSGNLDIICAYPLSENAIYHMRWSGAEKFREAPRLFYVSDKKTTGYIKRYKNLIEAVVLNAGHMVPTDQPEVTLELMDDFINKRI